MGLSVITVQPSMGGGTGNDPVKLGGGTGNDPVKLGGGTGNDSAKFMQRGDAMGLRDRLNQELDGKGIAFATSEPKQIGGRWTTTLTVRNRNDIPPDILDEKKVFMGLKVNVQVDESVGQ